MLIHVLMGVIGGYFVHDIFLGSSLYNLIFWGVVGSLLPDLDHFLFFYIYGRKSEYSKIVRGYIKDRKFRQLLAFWKFNHKKNTGLFSHNILATILALYMFAYFVLVKDTPSFSVLALAWFMHYSFDLGEDILFMKKINPNWYFKFDREKAREKLVMP
jgi:hypothetical protein